jgi:hypothetical protein
LPNRQVRENPVEVLNRPDNLKRIAEFKAAAEKQLQTRVEAVAVAEKLFDPVALIKRANTIHEVNHPVLGLIKFGELKISDSLLVDKCTSKNDKTAMAVYLMLKKAYSELPDYTPETICEFYRVFPLVEGGALLAFFLSQPCFLGTN